MQSTSAANDPDAGMDVVAAGLQARILHHQQHGQQNFDAVLDSQKQLTASLRMIMQALDQIQALAPAQATAEQAALLKGLPVRAKALQSKLHTIDARLQRIKGLVEQQESRKQQKQVIVEAESGQPTSNEDGSNDTSGVT